MWQRNAVLGVIVVLSLSALLAVQVTTHRGLLLAAAFGAVPPVAMTTLIEFAPAGVQGEPQEGRCWTRSVAVARDNAWRCMVVNSIYDPCFSSEESEDAVVCDATPMNDGLGFRLDLTEPLPTETPLFSEGIHPWIIELEDGRICSFLQGATRGFEGQRLNYGCGEETYILGDPRPDDVWIASEVTLSPDFSSIIRSQETPIRTIWY